MNISAIFIKKPVMTILVMCGILLFGAIGYHQLPVSDLPDMEVPTIVVSANLPGAIPGTMASSVATPLEQQLSSVSALNFMSSSSTLGQTQITLQFNLNRSIDAAAQDVQAAITAANKLLPTNLPSPPTYRKVNPSSAPILYLALSSDILPLNEVDNYAETLLAQRISMVDGVAQVNVFGTQKFAVRIQLDPNQLASRGLTLSAINNVINANNVNLSTGSLNAPLVSLPVYADGQLLHADAYRPLIISYQNGAPVRIQDLGDAVDSVQNTLVASWYNKSRAIVLAVQREAGSNTLGVIKSIKALLPTFQKSLPPSIKLNVVYDRSPSILAAVHDVQSALLIAMILVVLVIFLFLRNISATIIPSIAMPVSIIGTFGVMYLCHFSLDTISLMALTLTVGFIVDDAIVMLENISRHMENGESPYRAAMNASKEISFTILSMTLSLVAVFIPVLFMGGIIGRLFHEFAITTVSAILISGLVSITLTPMLGSRFLKVGHPKKLNFIFNHTENLFKKSLSLYDKTLQWSLRNSHQIFQLFFLSLFATFLLFAIIPKGFIPTQDVDQLVGFTEADASVSFNAMVKRQQMAMGIIQKDPDITGTVSVVGAGGTTNTLNNGRIFMKLKPRAERKRSADEILQDLRAPLAKIAGLKVYLQNIPAVSLGQLTKATYQYSLQDTDVNELGVWTDRFSQRLAKIPQIQDVNNDLQAQTSQIKVIVNRQKAAALGISLEEIQNELGFAYGMQQISTIYTPISSFWVVIELQSKFQKDPDALKLLYLKSSNGGIVPLDAVATLVMGHEPLSVNHVQQLPSATISFNLKPGASLSEAVKAINEAYKDLNPPPSLLMGFQGTAQTFKSSQQGLALLLLLATLVIYLILGILYESFIHPLTILSGLPAAAVGALIALLLFYGELNIYGFIGIIMLIGIVKKNAIMMIDFAIDAQREQKMSAADAIYHACLIRFRPIMMTTLAALFGTLPLALAFGSGAETLRPLGIAVVGGLLLSQLLTLYITPVIYLFFERRAKRLSFSEISDGV